MPESREPQLSVALSPADWEGCQIALWELAFTAEEELGELEKQVDAAYELHGQKKSIENENNYWDLFKRLNELKNQEADLLRVIEKVEEGTATEEDVLPFFPQDPAEDDEPLLSKKKRAMLVEAERRGDQSDLQLRLASLGIDTLMVTGNGSETTRLTTGRRQTKVRMNLTAFAAENEFSYRTADTHGGKMRGTSNKGKKNRGGKSRV